MDICQIVYAAAIAEAGSFSKAAERLYISQPALSQRIKRLEAELGYPLFRRSPQGVSPTPAGERFCRASYPLIEAWEQFQEQTAEEQTLAKRRLHIGIGARAYSNGLFEEVVHFFDAHPDIEVTFITEAGQDYLSAVREGALDLAIDRFPPEALLPSRKGLYSADLICEKQCVLMSWNDPRSSWKHISCADLQGCTMISALESSIEDRTLQYFCETHRIALRRIYRADSIDTIMSMVQAGRGLVIGPKSFADYFGVAGVTLVPEINVYLKFICKKADSQRREVALLRKYLEQVCREQRASWGTRE